MRKISLSSTDSKASIIAFLWEAGSYSYKMGLKFSERNGSVVGAKLVGDHDELMLITTGGVLIRTRVSEIRELGRATQGVTLINLGPDEKLRGLEKVAESEHDDDDEDTVS